ncbi:glucosidase II alpha subunit [Histoplasma capsulatum var. duboisii H88]|uniref:alpha-glucosidase n=1 Tax=Ajellomyces capsulatus (strain H88) TaxID=544711 RepID=F0UQ02_AJEC8|nr:glucosidase II alpha subunit [Histoplasma capsulatum var. duboisii H88]QSS53224.1 glucosidase II alpha subunit [Histoplasma capsulatum var. duboisii H88]
MAAFRLLSTGWTLFLAILTILSCLVVPGEMVKHGNFKTCSQSGFCARNRAYADTVSNQGSSWSAPYRLESNSIKFAGGQLLGTIVKTAENNENVKLPLTVSFLTSGVARVTVDEEKRIKGKIQLRHDRKIRKERYNEAAKWAIVGGLELSSSAEIVEGTEAGITKVAYGPDKKFLAIIRHSPFEVHFQRDGETHIKFNDKGLLNVEHWRPKVEKPKGDNNEPESQTTVDEATWWEESFGGNVDSKPRGPESVGLDITFSGYSHVFGIPEHADSLSLKETRGGDGQHTEPYRLYNSDVFEYELNSPMTLYGSIPFMQAHRRGSTVGVLWLNAAETWVDIVKTKDSTNPLALGVIGKTNTQTHWFSEAGQLDIFVFLGPTPQAVSKSYGELTGFTQLPQHFAIGYHQCRWNYVTDEDVRDVDRKFDLYQIPYDVIWLDIEYTDQKKYFTWDPLTFTDPSGMQKQLDDSGRKLVIIIDPHIKNDANYPIVDELKSKGLAVNDKDGNIYDGWCWPGSSHWIDCFNPAAVSWWTTLFKYDKFKGTSSNVFLWNDMNEPSVFNGPETTMPKDNIHYGGWEHRDLHNLNGMTFINATYNALLERKKGELRRPFVLTRSFYAGSQRLGAMWTGDNQASWDHLAASLPMVLNNGIAGFPFAGADVGGFFGNPDKELLTRWYQTGIFYPFFRAHAHIDTRRREPYLAGEPYMSIITQAIHLRYQLLPAWYTAFHQASIDGTPIVQPQYYVHPEDDAGFAIDDQLYLGSTGLLAKPIVTEGATSTDIFLADDEKYYDYFDYTVYQGAGKRHIVEAPLDKIPLLMQGGHIIPRKDRPRRSSQLMKWDPYTLLVVLDKNEQAEGTLYIDDGETFDYQDGASIHRRFTFSESSLSSTDIGTQGTKTAQYLKAMAGVRVEKIIIVGAPDAWASKPNVLVFGEGSKTGSQASLQWHAKQEGKAAHAVVKNPGVSIGNLWRIDFS